MSQRKKSDLRKRGVEIALKLFEKIYIPLEHEEYFESDERIITRTNLRNMLEAAREADRIRSYDWFKLKAVYIARNANPNDQLYMYVKNLLRMLEEYGKNEEEKIKLAIYTLEASIYIFTGLRKGLKKIIYGRR